MSASDTKYVIGNWNTKTFEKWWLEKIGINRNNFSNEYTKAGTNYEHKILDSLELDDLEKDKQIIIDKLRVNLDGNTPDKIYEVKTYRFEKDFKVPKSYIEQVQVQMYASGIKEACIVAYGLIESDYDNYFHEIDKERLSIHDIEYKEEFINDNYLPKLRYLTICLKIGRFPNKEDFQKERKDERI